MNPRSLARFFLAVALLAALWPAFPGASPAAAQELRAGGAYAIPNIQGVADSWGEGLGFRWIFRNGWGVGVEYDRYSGSDRFRGPVCVDAGEPGEICQIDDLRFESDMDMLTLLVIAELLRSEEWGVRLMVGRAAGTIRGAGVGEQTGGTVAPPPADRGASLFAWDRGADGSVAVVEVLRALPVPRVPIHVRMALRSHRVEMHGCELEIYSPFCGRLGITEFQLGGVVAWPRGGGQGR